MEKMKRTVSMLLCAAMLLTGMPGVSFAAEAVETLPTEPAVLSEEPVSEDLAQAVSLPASGSCGENVTWTLSESGLLTISGTGDYRAIPSEYRDYVTSAVISQGLTTIPARMFYGYENLTEIQIPSGVTSIGAGAFYQCASLQQLRLPEELTSIDHHAFYGCAALTTVTVPKGVTVIPKFAFNGCSSLAEVVLPYGVTEIGDAAFGNCTALADIALPASLTVMGTSAFEFCENLTEVVIPASLKMLPNYAFCRCTKLEKLVIPEGVTAIGENLLVDCARLTQIDLPSTVTTIGMGAFYGCTGLTEMYIPAGVTDLSCHAFMNCSNLTAIRVDPANACYSNDPSGVLFNKDKTALVIFPLGLSGSYVIPQGVTAIGEYAFDSNQTLYEIDIPDTVTSIGEAAFRRCKGLTSVELPDALTYLGHSAFQSCTGITQIEIPGGVSEIGWQTFDGCHALGSVILNEGLTVIGADAFSYNETLQSVILPDTVTTVEAGAFAYCIALTEIVISANIERMERDIFSFCNKLTTVTFNGSAPLFDEDTFDPGYNMSVHGKLSATAYYPIDNLTWTDEKLEGHAGIKEWIGTLLIDDTRYLGYGSCGDGVNWGLKIDGTLILYGKGGLYACEAGAFPWSEHAGSITSLMVTRGVTEIPAYAFAGCKNLKTVITVARTVGTLGANAFAGCAALEDIHFDGGVSHIADNAFAGCGSLAQITLPASVTHLGENVFGGCDSLTAICVEPENTVFCHDRYGVLYNKAKTRILAVPAGLTGTYPVPSGVQEVAPFAFAGCSQALEVTFQAAPPTFADLSFHLSNATVYYPVDQAGWTDGVKQNYGGQLTWISYDPTISFSSDFALRQKTDNLSVVLRVMEETKTLLTVLDRWRLQDVKVISVHGQHVAADGTYTLSQNEAAQQTVVLKKEGFQDYIIPMAVSASLASVLAGDTLPGNNIHYTLDVFMSRDDKSGKPYISTVFGRESNINAPYQELRSAQLKLEEGSRADIIISVVGAKEGQTTYYIGQDSDHCLSNDTGIFSSAYLYSTLDRGKPVYAYAVIDGQTTEPVKLCIQKMAPRSEELETFLKTSSFSLMGEDGLLIQIPEEFPLVGGGKIDLAAFKAPLGIYVSGSKIKLSFGVDVFSREKDFDGSWEDPIQGKNAREKLFSAFKKEFSEFSLKKAFKDAQEELDYYRMFQEKYSDDYYAYYTEKRNFDVEFLGYAEAEIVNGQLVLKEILVKVAGKFTFRYTQQGAIWVIPAYYYVEAGAEFGFTANSARLVADKQVPMKLGFQIDFTPRLKIGGGAGVAGAVSAGIWGEGKIPFLWEVSRDHLKLGLSGSFGVEAEFFVLKGDLSLLSGEFTLVDWYYGDAPQEAVAAMLAQDLAPADTAAVVSRDYAGLTSQWQGQPAGAYASTEAGIRFHTLQSGVFNRSQPQIGQCGDGLIMVWVEDDPSRDSYNRMRLVYSLQAADGTWSQPQPVWDDGHNDAYPSLVSDGTNICVAWQKINKTLSAEDCTDADALLANSEIFLAKFDTQTGAFSQAQQLTDNDVYDYAPAVTLNKGNPVVWYAAVPVGQLNQAGAHTLYRYKTKAETIETELNFLLSISAEGNRVCYCMDVDGDLGTASDIGAFSVESFLFSYYSDAFEKQEQDGAFTWAAYGKPDGKTTLFVSDMTNFYYMDGWKRKAVLDTHRSISGSINLLQTDTATHLFWTETEDSGNAIYTVAFQNGVWSKPVKVGYSGSTLRDGDMAALNGQFLGVCNADTQKGLTDLVFFQIREFTDLSVTDCIYFDETSVLPGREQTFDVLLRNLGTLEIAQAEFTVSDGLGTEHTFTQTLSLPSGASQRVTLTYPVPETYTGTTLTVTAAVPGMQDAVPENNTVSLEIGHPDLAVLEDSVHVLENGYLLNLAVENNSLARAENVTLAVRTQSRDAAPAHTLSLGTLDRNTYASVQVHVPTDQLRFDEAGIARVYLSAESHRADAAEADNRLCILLVLPTEEACAHLLVQTVPAQRPDCTNPGYTAYRQCQVCLEILDGYEILPALGHDYEGFYTLPTCTEPGSTTYICSCGDSYTVSNEPPLGHSWSQWTQTVKPDENRDGERSRTCLICGVDERETVDNNIFTDVKQDRFEKAILWAYYNGITTGTGDGTTFSPENACTRKQIVTFLWRAAGEPEPESMVNPFQDVKQDRFEKAILWAYYAGITAGTGDGSTFSPENTCTRKQIVTFLWRYNGQPAPESMENRFVDVKNDRFTAAILWAAEQGITTGTGDGTTFSPEAPCTRKQIVTFLYRDLNKEN